MGFSNGISEPLSMDRRGVRFTGGAVYVDETPEREYDIDEAMEEEEDGD